MIYPRTNPTHYGTGLPQYHLWFDTMDDFAGLPGLDECAPGSDATCVDNGDVYILRGDTGTWEVL